MGYKRMIMDACGCTEKEAEEVEELMRMITGGVLDNLTKRRFNATARLAYDTYQEMLREEPYHPWLTRHEGSATV